MTEDRRGAENNVLLAVAGMAIGVVGAAGYAAWRAVSAEEATSGERWSTFGEAMLFPGSLIVVVITIIVVLGWKANIDG